MIDYSNIFSFCRVELMNNAWKQEIWWLFWSWQKFKKRSCRVLTLYENVCLRKVSSIEQSFKWPITISVAGGSTLFFFSEFFIYLPARTQSSFLQGNRRRGSETTYIWCVGLKENWTAEVKINRQFQKSSTTVTVVWVGCFFVCD